MDHKIYKDCLILMLQDLMPLTTEYDERVWTIVMLLNKADKMTEAELAKETERLEGWLQDLG